MREEWIFENDFMYRNAPVPDDLESTFESMESSRDGYIICCAFTMLHVSLRGSRRLCKVAFPGKKWVRRLSRSCGRPRWLRRLSRPRGRLRPREKCDTCKSGFAGIAPDGLFYWAIFLSLMVGDPVPGEISAKSQAARHRVHRPSLRSSDRGRVSSRVGFSRGLCSLRLPAPSSPLLGSLPPAACLM